MMKFWYKEEAKFSDEMDFPVYSDDLNLWTKMYLSNKTNYLLFLNKKFYLQVWEN